MYTVNQEYKNEIEVERSSFISYLIPCCNESDAKNILLAMRKEHPKARHVCYSYCINGNYKSSDDGEPKGTAGRPIQDLLQKRQLNNVLLIVVRYFGGILLGASRLLRTYVDSSLSVINKAKLLEIKTCNIYRVEIQHSDFDTFKKYCQYNNITIKNIEFFECISLEIYSESDIIEDVNSFFNGKLNITFLKKDEVLV
ncbi:MAG: IMPACT family protein [Bacilli bacterium]